MKVKRKNMSDVSQVIPDLCAVDDLQHNHFFLKLLYRLDAKQITAADALAALNKRVIAKNQRFPFSKSELITGLDEREKIDFFELSAGKIL